MNDQNGGQLGAGCFAEWIDDNDLERIEKDAGPAQTAANEQIPASTTVEVGTVTNEGTRIDSGSAASFSSSAAISKADEITADEDCVTAALEATCDRTSCENGDQKRLDDSGKQNEHSPTAVKSCSSTECRCEACRKKSTAPELGSQGDSHNETTERPYRLYKKKAVPPNLQSLPESLRRYLDSPSSDEDPWLPEGLLRDPSIIPNWIMDAAEEEL